MSCLVKFGVTLATLLFAGATIAQTPAAKPSRVRGEIVSMNGDTMIATPVKAGEYAATRVVVEKDGVAPPM